MKSAIVVFELSMPGRSSWNGGWSGSSDYYGKVVSLGSSQKAHCRVPLHVAF